MHKTPTILILLILSAFFNIVNFSPAAQVTLLKHDNSEIEGQLEKITDQAIFIKNAIFKSDNQAKNTTKPATKALAIFKKEDIKRIIYKETDKESAKEKSKESKNTNQIKVQTDKVTIKSDIPKDKLIKMALEQKKKHPSAGYVTLIDHELGEYIDEKNEVSTYHGAYIILKDDFKSLARVSSWVDETRGTYKVLFGRIIYPDGREFYMNPDDLVKSAPPGMGAAFFSSGYSVLHYNFPNPSAGCIIEYKTYRTSFLPYIDDFYSNRFTFNSSQPVLSTEFEIVMPKEKPLHWVSRNLSEEEDKPKISTKNGKTTYLWSFGEQKPIISEPMMPANGDIAKRVYVSNQKDNDFLFKWNRKMLGANTKVTPYIKTRLKEILKDVSKDKEEILKYLYHWVQTKIRYVSVKSGSMSGMAGHPAEETLRNNFGDCVDKSVLFSTLLKASGIEAYPISIKTNPGEEMESRIPCFNANHSITEVRLNGKKMILDTTTTNYSYPNFRIDDHGVPVRNAFTKKVYRTPVPPPANNASNYTRKMALSSAGSMKVKFEGKYTGPRSAGLRGYYKTIAKKDLKKVFQRLVSQDAADAKLIDYGIDNIYDLNKNVRIIYSYSSKDPLSKAGNLYILENNSTLPYSFSEVSLKKRSYDIEYMSSVRRKNTDTYTLAPQWKVEFIPKPIEIKTKYMHYKAQWTQTKDDEITFTNLYDRFERIVPVKDYASYKANVQKIMNFESENVLLKKDKAKNYADLLILRDGIEIDGELISSSAKKITFESKKEKTIKAYNADEVLSVEMAFVPSGEINQTVDEILDGPLSRALEVDTDVEKYKGDLKVVLLDSHKIKLNNDGTYTWTSRVITKILKEKGKAAGFDNWTYDPLKEKFTIDFGRTINGKKVTNLSSRTIQSKATISSYPEYKRKRNQKFALPDIKIGSILDYQVTRIIKADTIHHVFTLPLERGSIGDSHTLDAGSNDSWNCAPNSFYAAVPVIQKEIEINVPSEFKINQKIINDSNNVIKFNKVKAGNRTIFQYMNINPLKAAEAELDKPEISDYQPMILFAEKRNWKEIYKDIRKHFVPGREDLNAAKDQIKKLRKEGKAKFEDIYEFVAMSITHAGVGLRTCSPKPNSIKQILENKRGSSLDCAWLLTCLLKAYGAEATIGFAPTSWFTRYHFKDIPTLAWISKPLVYVRFKHKTYILNASTSNKKMIDSASSWEDTELMLIDHSGIKFLPLSDTYRNEVVRKLKGSINANGDLYIKSYEIKPKGMYQGSYRSLRSILKEKWPLIAQQGMSSLHPNAVVKSFSFKHVDNLKKDVHLSYEVNIPDYGKKAGDYILFQLPGIYHNLGNAAATEDRVIAGIDLGVNKTQIRKYEIKLPKGYSVYYLPKTLKLNEGVYAYTAKLKVKEKKNGTKLKFTETIKVSGPVFPKELYLKYKKMRKAIADFSKEYIILKKK